MKLILTEKPSVANDIANAIGSPKKNDGYIEVNDYCITWAFGHLFKMDDSLYNGERWTLEGLPILPDSFNYVAIDDKKKQVSIINSLLKKCDSFVLATDAGREGELIGREILLSANFRNPNSYRLWTSEALTPAVVNRELSKLKPLSQFDSLYYSAKSRQEADWVVGINLTRLFTVKGNSKWTVGRVQTPTLALIVERDLVIDDFKPQEYYIVKGIFEKDNIAFEGQLRFEKEAEEDIRLNKERAFQIVSALKNSGQAKVKSITAEEKKQNPPLLFSLTSLQRMCNRKFGFSAQKTLDIAQKLYETYKCISYPRTDSNYLAESTFDLAKEKLKLFASNTVDINRPGKRVFDNSKLTDHHAIIPLNYYSGNNDDEKAVFELIKSNFVAAFMDVYIYETTSVIINVDNLSFFANGKKEIQKGWLAVYSEDNEDEEQIKLPRLKPDDLVKFSNPKALQQFTKPPKRYTEESLLAIMEKLGLGTPATRAAIIERLLNVSYLIREKKNLISTSKGKELIQVLVDSPVKNAEMTADWENKLDQIYKNNSGYNGYKSFLNEIKSFISSEVNNFKTTEVTKTREATPKMLELANKLAKQNKASFDNKNIDYQYVHTFITEQLEKAKEGIPCLCGGGVVNITPKAYTCSCGKLVWNEYYKKKITQNQALQLLKGDTIEIKGLTSFKTKTKFDAKVKLKDSKGGIDLIFN